MCLNMTLHLDGYKYII
uniref:Uncharacterized protein n=1 Tax=Anguilla anguilla TaxID=7936 RepID=A0A0E9TVK3_ANGAN